MSGRYARSLVFAGMFLSAGIGFCQQPERIPFSIFDYVTIPIHESLAVLDEPKIESSVFYQNKAYCNHELDLVIKIKNKGKETIEQIEFRIILDDKDSVQYRWTGLLQVEQSAEIKVDDIRLPSGAIDLKVKWVSINGLSKIEDLSIGQSEFKFYTVQAKAFSHEIKESFDIQKTGELPEHVMIDNPYNVRIYTVASDVTSEPKPAPLGGFGLSEASMRFDFFDIPAGVPGAVVFDKIDLRKRKQSKLIYSRAYAQRTIEDDKLIIEVSSDCGINWKQLQNISGASMATAPRSPSRRFYPDQNQWKREELDLSACDGMPELIVRFRGISAKGNSLFLDDIVVSSELVNSNDNETEKTLSIYPLPVGNYFIMQSGEEPVSIYLQAMAGSDVYYSNNISSAGNDTWRINLPGNITAGSYVLHCRTRQKTHIKKIFKI